MPHKPPSPPPTPFPLLSLPPELRQIIYRHTILSPTPIPLYPRCRSALRTIYTTTLRSGTRFHTHSDAQHLATRLALTQTSRQLYIEVTAIYYAENTFTLYYLPPLQKMPAWYRKQQIQCAAAERNFARVIGVRNARRVRRLTLYPYFGMQVGRLVEQFPNLQRLEFTCFLEHHVRSGLRSVVFDGNVDEDGNDGRDEDHDDKVDEEDRGALFFRRLARWVRGRQDGFVLVINGRVWDQGGQRSLWDTALKDLSPTELYGREMKRPDGVVGRSKMLGLNGCL